MKGCSDARVHGDPACEVPFGESAFILILKDRRLSEDEREFVEYLKGMAAGLVHEHDDGTRFLLRELRPDHPARRFARRVNPDWEQKLSRSQDSN